MRLCIARGFVNGSTMPTLESCGWNRLKINVMRLTRRWRKRLQTLSSSAVNRTRTVLNAMARATLERIQKRTFTSPVPAVVDIMTKELTAAKPAAKPAPTMVEQPLSDLETFLGLVADVGKALRLDPASSIYLAYRDDKFRLVAAWATNGQNFRVHSRYLLPNMSAVELAEVANEFGASVKRQLSAPSN